MTDDRHTILVADDEPEIADLYTVWLQRDHEVRTAYRGTEVLDLVDDEVEMVFLDRRMPTMTGDEVIAELRDRELHCSVVLMTAVDPDFDIVDIDLDEYLTKPVMRDDLEEIVERLRDRPTDDETVRRYHALRSKKQTLESEKTRSELKHSDAYRRLVDRIRDLAAETDLDPPNEEFPFESPDS